MIKSEGEGEGPFSFVSRLPSPSSSSASSPVLDTFEGRSTRETMVLGSLFLWESSSRLAKSSLKTRSILENFIDRRLFFDAFF